MLSGLQLALELDPTWYSDNLSRLARCHESPEKYPFLVNLIHTVLDAVTKIMLLNLVACIWFVDYRIKRVKSKRVAASEDPEERRHIFRASDRQFIEVMEFQEKEWDTRFEDPDSPYHGAGWAYQFVNALEAEHGRRCDELDEEFERLDGVRAIKPEIDRYRVWFGALACEYLSDAP